jgi:ribosomal-protein-alanine N-acetyltransferase
MYRSDSIPTMYTERLILRRWTAEDADRLLAILSEEDILRYFPAALPWGREKAERYIAHHEVHWKERGYGHWAVVRDGQVIGWNGLEYLPESRETEAAYLLSRAAWGQGYASEAARAAIRFGFSQAGLEQIVGLAHPQNAASRRVLEKCGLRLFDRKVYWGLEVCRYCITRSEFEKLHAS